MLLSGTTSNVIYPSERRHPAHSQDILVRVDALARYLCWNKYDPTGDGKRARNCWAKAYDRFSRMQRSPHWWKLSCPRQFAIANPTGDVIPNYKDPEPFGSPLPKEPIDIEEMRAELKTEISQASLSPRDVRLIKQALKRSREGSPFDNKLFVLWVALRGVARLVGIEGGVVSGVFNLESSDVEASDRRPRHDDHYHEA